MLTGVSSISSLDSTFAKEIKEPGTLPLSQPVLPKQEGNQSISTAIEARNVATTAANNSVEKPLAPTYKRIVIFGDSLSDQGKMHDKSNEMIPTANDYWSGRFSNGPVWSDYLTEALGQDGIDVKVCAEGGSTCYDYNKLSYNPHYDIISNLSHQIEAFEKNDQIQEDDLVIIWFGGNDYLTHEWNTTEDVERLTNHLTKVTKELIEKNNCQVVLFDLPDLGLTPAAKAEDLEEESSAAANLHNQRLRNSAFWINHSNDPKLQDRPVRVFGVSKLFNELVQDPKRFGVTSMDAVHDEGLVWTFGDDEMKAQHLKTPEVLVSRKIQESALLGPIANKLAQKPSVHFSYPAVTREENKHAFWDSVHPTTNTHYHIAKRAEYFIKQNYHKADSE